MSGLKTDRLFRFTNLAFNLDVSEEFLDCLRVNAAPTPCQLALEGMFDKRLAISLKLFARDFQAFETFVEFGEQLLDLSDELWRNLGDDGVRKAAYRGG
ncbi:hypothetical protein ABIF65_007417 [Bradyrhizobium japonicum]|uniref:hypothetical protein n=1 Tax=Bradyrhizobium TaxID=374 RepID=UPI001AEC9803